ncbi:MAG: metal-sulfur cluster assembly factor [Candidatus Kapaibacterium sp.]|jgi:metal-sulfur cluster biosynthetic enzyme
MNIFKLSEGDMNPEFAAKPVNQDDLNLTGSIEEDQLSQERGLVLETLRSILDPELGINVIDLGLVYELRVEPNEIYVKMTMTTPGCPMHGSIIEAVERALKMFFPLKTSSVDLVWEPQWTPERLSPGAKEQLGFR